MNLKQFPQYHGRTLREIAETTNRRRSGWAVYALCGDDDVLGDAVGEGFYVEDIIQQHPEVANWVVKYTNDYMGMIVLRAAKPSED